MCVDASSPAWPPGRQTSCRSRQTLGRLERGRARHPAGGRQQMAVMTDLEVHLADRPGTAAAVGEALGAAGVNIEGVCGHGGSDGGVVHMLVSDAEGARAALTGAGIKISVERLAHGVQCPNRPGAMGRLLRRLATGDINVR